MELEQNKPIGVFDSGLGGLTVVKAIRKELPYEDIIYFGDTARVPYGNKSKDTIKRFAYEIMDFMLSCGVKLVVVACNTASSLSLAALKKKYSVPIIGVISPGVMAAKESSGNRKIGIIGTASTISSGAYQREFGKLDKAYSLVTKSCPLFVPLVENHMTDDDIAYKVAMKYLKGMGGIDSLILGCTHYPILKKVISKVLGKKVQLIDSSYAVAREVKKVLEEKDLRSSSRSKRIKCFVSDDVAGFKKGAKIFLKEEIIVKKAVL